MPKTDASAAPRDRGARIDTALDDLERRIDEEDHAPVVAHRAALATLVEEALRQAAEIDGLQEFRAGFVADQLSLRNPALDRIRGAPRQHVLARARSAAASAIMLLDSRSGLRAIVAAVRETSLEQLKTYPTWTEEQRRIFATRLRPNPAEHLQRLRQELDAALAHLADILEGRPPITEAQGTGPVFRDETRPRHRPARMD